jgi:hypothetical protein
MLVRFPPIKSNNKLRISMKNKKNNVKNYRSLKKTKLKSSNKKRVRKNRIMSKL